MGRRHDAQDLTAALNDLDLLAADGSRLWLLCGHCGLLKGLLVLLGQLKVVLYLNI